MKLSNKLASLTSDNMVEELSALLTNSIVKISWFGDRSVFIDGYEGEVTINELAKVFFKAKELDPKNKCTLKDRIDCDDLWGEIQKLYDRSNNKMSAPYSFFVHATEFRPWCRACAGDPQAIIGEWDSGGNRDQLFHFEPAEFREIFGDTVEPTSRCYSSTGKTWGVEREVIEQMLKEQAKTIELSH